MMAEIAKEFLMIIKKQMFSFVHQEGELQQDATVAFFATVQTEKITN